MTRGPLTEDEVRSHLHAVLEDVSASPRPFADLRRAVVRRRRQRQAVAAVAAGILAAVGISVGLSATGGSAAGRADKIVPAVQVDPVPALQAYVAAHGGTSASAVLPAADGGTYAADLEAGKVHVLSFDGYAWGSVAVLGAPLSGPPVVAVHRGPVNAGDAAAFQVDEAGGDAVINGVVVKSFGDWRYAPFDCGGSHVACAGFGNNSVVTYISDGTEVGGAVHSEPNTCTPSCVAGTRYDVTWRWDSVNGEFIVASSVKKGAG